MSAPADGPRLYAAGGWGLAPFYAGPPPVELPPHDFILTSAREGKVEWVWLWKL